MKFPPERVLPWFSGKPKGQTLQFATVASLKGMVTLEDPTAPALDV